MKAMMKDLRSVDAYAWLDLEFILKMMSSGGKEALQRKLMHLMPSPSKAAELGSVCKHCEAVLESDLYKFASLAVQGAVKQAVSLVSQLRQGEQPLVSSGADPWLIRFHNTMQFFYRKTVTEKEAIEGKMVSKKKELSGEAAIAAIWKEHKSKPIEELTLKLLEPVYVMQHTLPAEEAVEFNTLWSAVGIATRERRTATTKRKAETSAEQKKSAKAATTKERARSSAQSMFK
eukprot:6480040-Amphidinium_carterae.1